MNTPNKIIFIIIVSLAGIVLATSCSKESEINKRKKRGDKQPAAVNASSTFSQGKDSITAVREGQYVNLNWQIDPAGRKIKEINIMRSSTGVSRQKKVAGMEPGATGFKDCLPDENAYWYWVQLVMSDGKFQNAGQVRVDRDNAGPSNYIKIENVYKISIIRTDNFATLKWDFPEGDYKDIRILRYPRPVAELLRGQLTGKGKGVLVTATMERKSQCTNALPDANSDYWYWFRITLKSGAVIDRGPIKAGYAGND